MVHSGVCNSESVCARLNCHPLAECHKGPSGIVECLCPPCPPIYSPVCGNNNQTYNSECELYRTSCVTKSDVMLDYHGVCTARPCLKSECMAPHSTCGSEATDPTRTVCHCPSCTHTFSPVCGDNSVLYDNICLLQQQACRDRQTIRRQPLQFCGKKYSTSQEILNSRRQAGS